MDSLRKIVEQVKSCNLCPLSKSRKKAVPGEGLDDAEAMIVGEAPGYNEDIEGRPFVGSAGKLLGELLESIGMRREEVFITNIVKCRPPKNRPPRVGERKACMPYLMRQIKIIRPHIICPLGNSALNALVGRMPIGEVHGKAIEREGVVYFPLYHPAAALYDGSLRSVLFSDFKKLKLILVD
ncbi:MAG: uracil-DNA glycosylase family protein [Thermoproteota archaeon]